MARQDRCVRRAPGYALTVEKVTGRAFDRQIGSTKRGDRYAAYRTRTGLAYNRQFCYATLNSEWSSGESRLKCPRALAGTAL